MAGHGGTDPDVIGVYRVDRDGGDRAVVSDRETAGNRGPMRAAVGGFVQSQARPRSRSSR